MTLKVALKALLHDADKWSEISTHLHNMSHTCSADLTLPSSAFSFLGDDVYTAYTGVQNFVTTFLQQGSTEAHNGDVALTKIHTIYAGTDEKAKDKLHDTWMWK